MRLYVSNRAQSVPNVKNAKKNTPDPETAEFVVILDDGSCSFAQRCTGDSGDIQTGPEYSLKCGIS